MRGHVSVHLVALPMLLPSGRAPALFRVGSESMNLRSEVRFPEPQAALSVEHFLNSLSLPLFCPLNA